MAMVTDLEADPPAIDRRSRAPAGVRLSWLSWLSGGLGRLGLGMWAIWGSMWVPAWVLVLSSLWPGQVAAGTLETIRSTGVIRVAYRDGSIPFAYDDEAGRPLGFSIDLCTRLVNNLREQLKLPTLRIQWSRVSAQDRLQVVSSGKVDMECGSTTNTAARREQHAFTMPTFIAGMKIMSHRSLAAGGLDDLVGRRVAASNATTALQLLNQANQARGGNSIRVIEVKGHREAWKMLESGEVDAWLTDDVLMTAYRATSPQAGSFVLSRRFLSIEPYGFVLRKEDAELLAIFNREIARLMRSGDYRRLYETWFTQPIPGQNVNLNHPMNEILRAHLQLPSETLPVLF